MEKCLTRLYQLEDCARTYELENCFSQTCGLMGRQGRIITYDLAKGRLKSIAPTKKHSSQFLKSKDSENFF